jgi:hypothetical protein
MPIKILAMAAALSLIGLAAGCDIGDRRLPPDFRVTKTPDPPGYGDDEPEPRPIQPRPAQGDRRADSPLDGRDGRPAREPGPPQSSDEAQSAQGVFIFAGLTTKAQLEGDPRLAVRTVSSGAGHEVIQVSSKGGVGRPINVVEKNQDSHDRSFQRVNLRVENGLVVGLSK